MRRRVSDTSKPAGGRQTTRQEIGVSETHRGGELFIVDNSVSGWTGIRYLSEWTEIATRFDIATGTFEIGSLLALDGRWQGLEKIRILMGADVTHPTRAAFLKAV